MTCCMQCSRLTRENVSRLNCVPGGLEFEGENLTGDMSGVVEWHVEMMKRGMTGRVFSRGDRIRGFVQYMPAETAPIPIIAPGSAVLLCFHYNVAPGEGENEHLGVERMMVERAAQEARSCFGGMTAVGWDHAVHFPIGLLEELGFRQVQREGDMALMWLPFAGSARLPELAPQTFHPRDLRREGRVAVDLSYSHRCPYDLHHRNRIRGLLDEMDPERISYREVQMDTRAQVLAHRAPSWNWQWLYVNGREVAWHQMTKDVLTSGPV